MNTFRQAAPDTTRITKAAVLRALTPEEKAAYRRWARIVLTFYCLVLIGVCIAVLRSYSTANSDGQLAQASPQGTISTRAGQ
jgi:hypothetical protein